MMLLTGVRRSYPWGSTTAMAEFLGTDSDGAPFAELWLGAHPTGPATALRDGTEVPLDALIAEDPEAHLGSRAAATFDSRLPYLLKFLAPGRPLSIQVHPTPELAASGFRDEEARGVPRSAANRNYKDSFHKPEMVYALTQFEGLVGFREPEVVAALLVTLDGVNGTTRFSRLSSCAPADILQGALEALLELSAEHVTGLLEDCASLSARSDLEAPARAAFSTAAELGASYPGDVGALVSLLLNRVVLAPGEVVFLGDGVPHAYLSGFALELMANSDNVLRLGLTNKHLDPDAMMANLDFTAIGYGLEVPVAIGASRVFAPPVTEFALAVAPADSARPTVMPGRGLRIVACIDGQVTLSAENDAARIDLTRGQAALVVDGDGQLTFTGAGELAQAFVP